MSTGLKEAQWYQIHTNGAQTTLARFYEGQDEVGGAVFYFEKLSVDIVNKTSEVFNGESFPTRDEAAHRLVRAYETQV